MMGRYLHHRDRLDPHPGSLYVVRWLSAYRSRDDVLMRRFSRECDARRFAQKLADKNHEHVAVFVTQVGKWREVR